jgi:adhesin transport system membrane fusion protein
MNDINNPKQGETPPVEIEPEEEHFLDTLGARLNPNQASNLLLWLIVGFFLVFIIWAALTEVDRTVRAQGRVIPSSRMQVASNLEGGIVTRINVNVGDAVQLGDALVELDTTMSGSELGSNRAQLTALNLRMLRLSAEITGRSPRFPAPASQSDAEQIEIERALYAARTEQLQSLNAASQARISQTHRAVSEARSMLAARSAALSAARHEVDILRPLVEHGIEPRLSLIRAEDAAAIAASEVQAAMATLSRAQASVSEYQATAVQNRQEWRSVAADELARVQTERAALRRRMPALQDRVERSMVRAPLAGRVNRVFTTTVGGTVRAGEPIAEIVPSEEGLVVEAAVRPNDIGQIRIGQPARVGITDYDATVYGRLEGTVVTISPDTFEEERSGATFYTVRVVTRGALLDGNGNPVTIGPGMTAEVSLLGDKQSILGYILTPITRLGRSALRE